MIGDFNKRKLLQIFVLGEAVFFLYSGLFFIYHIVSGTAPHAKVQFFVVWVPFQYVIPTTFFIDGLYFLITALGLTSYLDNVLGKIVRGVVFLISINFLYIGILIPFFVQHLTLQQFFTSGVGIVGLAVPSGLAIHVIFQYVIGGGILGPLLSIKHKIFVKVKQLLK